MKDYALAKIFSLVFLVVGLLTLTHYGINWDSINHLTRGQAYLNFYLTGKGDYSNLPKFDWYWQNPKSLLIKSDISIQNVPQRSFYESDETNYFWHLSNDGGHPVLSDILSSLFNKILFSKLRLINDIDSYRIYGLVLAASLVGLIFYWTSKAYGRFAGVIAAISLSLYPLFWSESHFNSQKDIPETVYWSFMLFSIWKGISKRSAKWITLSGLLFGLALGTKFNIIFSVFVLAPWLIFVVKKDIFKNKKLLISIAVAPVIGIAILFASWPYLWPDLYSGIFKIIGYYKDIGLTSNINTRFLGPLGINTYPIQWITYTTPIVILVLSVLGFISALLRLKKEKDKISFLFILWFLVPVVRVTIPGTTIYGGVRQIMEYIPAMAILSGLGASVVLKCFSRKKTTILVIILCFIPTVVKLIQIHPNENVYFNKLIGGLSGAKSKDIPSWGNSFGAAYRQGVVWINDNAPKGSKVAFARELMPNIPTIWFRPDISFSNGYRSGYTRQGEYVISLTYQGTDSYSYFDSYLDKFLSPVYEAKVDGVAIMKVWKNDDDHLKVNADDKLISNVNLVKDEEGLTFDLGETKNLSRLEIEYNENNCTPLKSGLVQLSADGKYYEQQWGALPRQWRIVTLGEQPQEEHFIEPFVGQQARFIKIQLKPFDTCLRNIKNYQVYSLNDLD
ncbi:ArnT family glycosyltransferase [Patescibacteria group bacterium]